MQKKIIALAVAAAFSTPAFADVGFYGIVDATIANVSAKGQQSDLIAISGGASQSRLGVKATEDLGNGLTGVAVLEYGLDSQDSSTVGAARQKMIAVAGDFGTVATGYLQTASYDFLAKYDPIYGSSSSAHSIAAAGHIVGSLAQRAPRAVAYISPNISGMTFAANYVTSYYTPTNGVLAAVGKDLGNLTVTDANNNALKMTAYIFSANYTLDALSVGAVYGGATDTSTNGGKFTEFAFGGSYDLGVAKVMGTYQSMTNDSNGAKSDTVFSLAGVMPVPTGAVAVMFASNTNAEAARQAGAGVSASSVSAKAFTAGYLHTFTKNTTGYLVFSNVTQGSNSPVYSVAGNLLGTGASKIGAGTLTAGGSSTLLGVGLRKKF